MGNQNAEVLITGESGRVYTLKNSFKGMRAVEQMFGVKFKEALTLADGGSQTHLSALIWCLLLQREPAMTLDAVDDFVDDCGGIVIVEKKLLEALGVSVPDPQDVKAMGVTENPPEAQASQRRHRTGERSTSRPGASA